MIHLTFAFSARKLQHYGVQQRELAWFKPYSTHQKKRQIGDLQHKTSLKTIMYRNIQNKIYISEALVRSQMISDVFQYLVSEFPWERHYKPKETVLQTRSSMTKSLWTFLLIGTVLVQQKRTFYVGCTDSKVEDITI